MLLEFLIQQWHLVGALAVSVTLLAIHESRRSGMTVSPQQLSRLVNEQQAAIIDLREPAEFRKGHIVGSLNIPFAKIDERWGELEQRREQPLILVCKIGQMASAAGKKLNAKKFPHVYRLSGGISEWQGAQLPLTKG